MAQRIQPTPGRVVLYRPDAGDHELYDGPSSFRAAHIAHVYGDDTVNLAVLDVSGHFHARLNVQLVQADEQPPLEREYCCWMPYQVGQAEKLAAVAADLATRVAQLEERLAEVVRRAGAVLGGG